MSDLEKRVKTLEDQIKKLTKEQKPKVKKAPSKFNLYMKEAVPKLKASDPEKYKGKQGHQLAFTEAARKWSERTKTTA